MKILILGYSTNVGGAEKRMLSFAQYSSLIHETQVITLVGGNDKFCGKYLRKNNIKTLNKTFKLSSIYKLLKIIRRESPDVIYGFLGNVNVMLGLFRWLFKDTKVIVRENATYNSYFRSKGIKGKILEKLYRVGLNNVDIIVAQSKFMKQEQTDLLRISEKKIRVLQNPLPKLEKIVESEFKFKTDIVYLLSVGRLELVKNNEDMLLALSRLEEKFELILIGEGSEKGNLYNLAKSLSITDRIHFVGHKNNLKHYYENSQLLLLTSERETSPNVILEATNYGLYSISYDMPGGIHSLITNGVNGEIIKRNDIKLLVNTILNNYNKKAYIPKGLIKTEDEYNEILLALTYNLVGSDTQ